MAKRKSPKGKVSPGWNLVRLTQQSGGLSYVEIVNPASVVEGGKGPGDIRYGRCSVRIYFSYGEPFACLKFSSRGILEGVDIRKSFLEEGRSKSSKEHVVAVFGTTDLAEISTKSSWSTSRVAFQDEPDFRETVFYSMHYGLSLIEEEIKKKNSCQRNTIDFDR